MAAVQWSRMQVLGMEVSGSNSGKFSGNFLQTVLCAFLPHGDYSLPVNILIAWCANFLGYVAHYCVS